MKAAKPKPKDDQIPRCTRCGIICVGGTHYLQMRETHDLVCETCSGVLGGTYRPKTQEVRS